MPEITYKEAITRALDEEMARDGRVFLLGEDIGLHGGVFGVTKGLFQKYGGERVRQTPISESAIIGAAVGAAMVGMRPVAEIMYFDFIATCMDQVINQAAKTRYMSAGQVEVPVVIRTQAGAGRGKGAQHSQYLEALFFHVPGVKVALPSTPYDAKGMLKSAIRDESPVLFIENAFLYNLKGEVPEGDYAVPLGEAVVRREGRDATVATYSVMVGACLEAAEELAKEGIETEVIDLRSVVPLDIDAVLRSVERTGRLLVVHQACRKGGVGAEIASLVMERAFDFLDAPVMRVGAKESPVPFAETLEKVVIPGVAEVVVACRELVRG